MSTHRAHSVTEREPGGTRSQSSSSSDEPEGPSHGGAALEAGDSGRFRDGWSAAMSLLGV